MFGSARLAWAVLLVSSASAQLASELTKEQLKPLTVFRQQHRRLACWCSFCTFFLLAMMFAGGWPPVRGCFCAGVANRAFSLRAGLLCLVSRTNVSTLGAQTHGPMQRNAVEQLHVCVLLGPEPRRRKRERVVLCRSPGA
ncbi:unnamed protein product [Effrenium voratum]|uniref:Secreted protein n=1 Tax=Effrenium voratum TaxID=2562239 RepID=A0AA36MKW6_9DINO|nr:unnamed protein product [Effrenium voratum]